MTQDGTLDRGMTGRVAGQPGRRHGGRARQHWGTRGPMYTNKDKNAPSYEKYSEWKDSEVLGAEVDEAYAKPASQNASRSLLRKIFTEDFIAGLEDCSIGFVGRENEEKTVEGIVDAALQFYDHYTIAPALAHEDKAPAEG